MHARTALIALAILAGSLIAASSAFAIGGCGPGGCEPGETEYVATLTVTPPNGGSVSGGSIACPGTCTEQFQYVCTGACTQFDYPVTTLTAARAGGFGPDWTGCTEVTAANACEVRMSSDATVSVAWLDTAPPTVSFAAVPAAGSRVGPNTVVTATAGDNVGVARVAFAAGSGPFTSDHSPPFQAQPLLGLPHGAVVNVSAQAFDTTGRSSTMATLANLQLDAQANVVLGTDPVGGTITRAATLPLAFTPDGDVVTRECRVDTGPFGPCTSPYAPDITGLPDGAHSYGVRATDDLGNTSSTAIRSFVIDRTNPVAAFTAGPFEGAIVGAPSTSFEFGVTDASATSTTCALDVNAPVACSSPHAVTGLTNGTHTLTVTSTDAAGNSAAIVRTFVVQLPVTVTPPVTTPLPGAGTGEDTPTILPAVSAPLTARFSTSPAGTRVTMLKLMKVPAGTQVQLRCAGKGCPFATRAVKVSRGRAVMTALVSGSVLRPGAALEVRLTRSGMRGTVLRHVVRKGAAPKRSVLCLAPGGTTPAAC